MWECRVGRLCVGVGGEGEFVRLRRGVVSKRRLEWGQFSRRVLCTTATKVHSLKGAAGRDCSSSLSQN